MTKHTKLSTGSSDSSPNDEEGPSIYIQEIKTLQRNSEMQTLARDREIALVTAPNCSHNNEFFTARQNSYPSTSVCQLLLSVCVINPVIHSTIVVLFINYIYF